MAHCSLTPSLVPYLHSLPAWSRVVRGMQPDKLVDWAKRSGKLRLDYALVIREEQIRRMDRHWRHGGSLGGWRE